MTVYRTHQGSGGDPAPSGPSAPPAPPVEICRRCGIVAPARGTACSACAEPLSQVRVAAPPGEGIWVAVRCAFTCNQCRFPAPLDALDASGAAECASCGLRQRFDLDAWREALDFAHAVGDLAGPAPEGRHPHPTLWIGSENPYAGVGDTRTFERKEGISTNALSVDAAPGHPVCGACRLPLSSRVTGAGAVTTECPQCGERASYALSDEARHLSGSLLGAVASEHRTDRPRARTTATQAGVVALTCPGCGAPLSIGPGGRLQVCPFCQASCIVPARSLSRARQDAPAPEIWWLLFQGASRLRRALEAPTTDGDGDAGSLKAAALARLKPGPQSAPVGEAPGVYEAPEIRGVYWPQVGLTLLAGGVAVAVGFALYEALWR
jgi:hypothetical protein